MQNNQKYAETLFDICKKSNCDALIQEQLNAVKKLYSKVPIFRLILLTKRIQNNDKVDIIKNSLQSFNPIIIEFISIIINGNQTNNMLNIISRFNHLVNSQNNIKKIDIITADKLDDGDLEELTKKICNALDSKPSINSIYDPNIIGGIKLRIGNKIYDNSISCQINQLKKNLHNM